MTTTPERDIHLVDTFQGEQVEIVGDFERILTYVQHEARRGVEDKILAEHLPALVAALEARDVEAAASAARHIAMRVSLAPLSITDPGLYDLRAEDYHADPIPDGSLSQSRAKILLDEAGPAKFRHREDHGRTERPEWDLGIAVHALVLGDGQERIVVVDAKTWQGGPAKAARTAAHAKGLTPILTHQMQQAEDMAEALTSHQQATEALQGQSEVAAFTRHESGLWLRGQMDKYAPGSHIGDYKTAADASSFGFSRAAYRFRYHMQAAWYRHLVAELTGDLLPYRIVAQEKAAPYLVSVWEPTRELLDMGRTDMDDAIDIYLHCTRAGEWPGYPDDVQALTAPDWALDDEIEV